MPDKRRKRLNGAVLGDPNDPRNTLGGHTTVPREGQPGPSAGRIIEDTANYARLRSAPDFDNATTYRHQVTFSFWNKLTAEQRQPYLRRMAEDWLGADAGGARLDQVAEQLEARNGAQLRDLDILVEAVEAYKPDDVKVAEDTNQEFMRSVVEREQRTMEIAGAYTDTFGGTAANFMSAMAGEVTTSYGGAVMLAPVHPFRWAGGTVATGITATMGRHGVFDMAAMSPFIYWNHRVVKEKWDRIGMTEEEVDAWLTNMAWMELGMVAGIRGGSSAVLDIGRGVARTAGRAGGAVKRARETGAQAQPAKAEAAGVRAGEAVKSAVERFRSRVGALGKEAKEAKGGEGS